MTDFKYYLDPKHRHFEGHFPGFPIFPGVGQISLVLLAIEAMRPSGKKLRCRKIARAKFRSVLKGGRELVIKITELREGEVRWSLEDEEKTIYSSGELSFVLCDE